MTLTARRAWKRFSTAYSANISGDRLIDVTIPVTSIAVTGGIHLAGVYIAANSIPKFFIGPLMSGLVQRNPGVSWCSIGNFIQALAIGVLWFFGVSSGGNESVFALAGFVSGFGAGVFGLAFQATIRNIVPSIKLPSANSNLEVIDSLFTLIIPVLAGVMVDAYGATPVLVATSLLFALAATFRLGLTAGGSADEVVARSVLGQSRVQAGGFFSKVVDTLSAPFKREYRRFISVSGIALGASSLLLIPVATVQIHGLGGGATAVGLAVSMAGAGGLVASILAGRLTAVTRSARWTLALLLMTLASVPLMFISPYLTGVVVLVFLSDAIASWLFVSLPTLRMATEDSSSLINITAGMMSWQALVAFSVGLGVSFSGEGVRLVIFVLLLTFMFAAVVVWQGRPRALAAVQRRMTELEQF